MTAVARVLVAVPTYRRIELLPALIAAIRPETSGLDARILLVDNDPDMSGRPVAAELGIEYLCERTPGIAAVRQAALDAAEPGELTVMIDDDVVPETGWLAGLIDVWRDTRATVVMGFVRYVWPEGTDPWITASAFAGRVQSPNGTRLSSLATGNVLIDTDQVRVLGARFDTTLGLLGGEDNLFGREIIAKGGTIVASADSVVRDDIIPERTTRDFIHRRAISHGQAYVHLRTRDAARWKQPILRALHLLGGSVRWVSFTAAHTSCRLRGDIAGDAAFQRRAWFAQGRMLAALGVVTTEYARTTDS